MNALEDKLGSLSVHKEVLGFNIKNIDNEFHIEIYLGRKKDVWFNFHQLNVGPHKNLHNAVDEALELLAEHLSDCSLC